MRRVNSRNIYFLLLCFCLLVFCGCTKSTREDAETDTTEAPATTEASATTEALETVTLKDAEIGDIVQMGTYEQDGDTETEDPIYWDVLDKDGDSILIISHDVIGYQRFSDSPNCVIWEDSQIRTWLNEEFYTDAFDKETQARIKGYVTSGVDEANQESRGDATDRIFLLSQKEIEKYYGHKLPKAEALLCKPSKAVLQRYEEIKQQRVREKIPFAESAPDVTEGISWMLRSTGKSQNHISIIRGDGYYSQCMADYYQGVRPAMWIYVGDENGEGQALQE